jgi:hypothetical protein
LPFADYQLIDGPEKCGQGFAASGRCRREQMPTRGDFPPSHRLDAGRFADAVDEPAGDKGMEEL